MSGNTKNSILRSRWLKLTLALCTAVLLYLFVSHINLLLSGLGSLTEFISPVITGLVMAYILNPFADLLEDHVFRNIKNNKTRHRISVFLTIAGGIAVLTLLLIVLIPQLVRSVAYLISHINVYTLQLQNLVNRIAGESASRNLDIANITNKVNELLGKVTSSIIGNYDSLVETSFSIGKQVINYVIAFILAVYFLLDKEKLVNGCARLLRALVNAGSYDRTIDFLGRCHRILIRYIAFDILDGIIIGLINFVFMRLTGMSYAGLVSIVVGVTNLAPTFGPIVGCVIGSFILVLINPVHALIFIIFTILLQFFDAYIFKPKLFGETLGVSPLWILIFIIVGSRMFGVWGILLAIPLSAIADFVYKEMIIARLEERRENRQEADDRDGESQTVIQSIRQEFDRIASDMDGNDEVPDPDEKRTLPDN